MWPFSFCLGAGEAGAVGGEGEGFVEEDGLGLDVDCEARVSCVAFSVAVWIRPATACFPA
jgi:hypothetical protein